MENLVRVLGDEGSFLLIHASEENGTKAGLMTVLSRPVGVLCVSGNITQSDLSIFHQALDQAMKTGTPLIFYFPETETIAKSTDLSAAVKALVRLSGVCPMLALVEKEAGNIAQMLLPYVDFCFFAQGAHERSSTVYQALDLPDAIERMRTLLHYLPLNCAESVPVIKTDARKKPEAAFVGPASMLSGLADPASVLEIYPEPDASVAFARVNGHSVGMLAAAQGSLPSHAARFMQFCDCYSFPLVIVSQQQFRPDALQLFMLSQATVPIVGIGCMEGCTALFDAVFSLTEKQLPALLASAVEYLSVKRDVPAPHKHRNLPL